MTSFFFKILIFLLPILGSTQVVDNFLVQPGLKISWNDNNRWGFNTSIEQRSVVSSDLKALHLQLAQFASYDIGFYSQFGIAVMYREIADQNRPEELRTSQQYVYTKNYNALKTAQRVRWEQRWLDDRLIHRWGYQFSSSLPLSGLFIDSSEFYMTAAVELLFIAESDIKPAYDQRISLGLGKKLNSNYKLQLTTEYRWEDFTSASERLLFFNLALYYSFK
jgi:hypothetical protein